MNGKYNVSQPAEAKEWVLENTGCLVYNLKMDIIFSPWG